MKKPRDESTWFFVDESGDTNFYNRKSKLIVGQKGCSSFFILGFIETQNPILIRHRVNDFKKQLINEPELQTIFSLPKSLTALHAKDDHALVRTRFFDVLPELDFQAQFLVIRKKGLEDEFLHRFKGSGDHMYDQLTSMLFGNVLHRYKHSHIIFSARGNRERHRPLHDAIRFAFNEFEKKVGKQIQCTLDVQAQRPSGEPCLSVIDYMTWAIQRAMVSQEFRYLELVQNKISLIWDRYHPQGRKIFTKKNPLTPDNLVPIE